ncbi:MAG: hypothetical protein U0359_20895 [Byssovorax sp.]
MQRLPLSSLFLSFLLAAGCGGTTVTSGSTTTGTGGSSSTTAGTGGSSSTTTVTTTTTGAGGQGGASTTTTTGAGGSGGCSGSIDLVADNGAPVHLASHCMGSWGDPSVGAEGYIFMGGPAPGIERLEIIGCKSDAANSEGVHLSAKDVMGTGTFTVGTTYYTAPDGSMWGVDGDPFEVKITSCGMVGDAIDGTFTAMVTHGGNAAHSLEGSFHVCRVEDELAP